MIARGASPRATLSLGAMAKSVAYVQGRDYVLPKDIQAVFVSTCAHRLLLSAEADAKGIWNWSKQRACARKSCWKVF